MVSGALVGLKADLLSGGLTLGGGLLAGGLIGALGAAGLARCVNLVRGTDSSWVAWNAQALDQLLEAALLRYLAVAHFGRGRGEWTQGESPAHWRDVVQRAMAPHRESLDIIWRERDARSATDETSPPSSFRSTLARAAKSLARSGDKASVGSTAASSGASNATAKDASNVPSNDLSNEASRASAASSDSTFDSPPPTSASPPTAPASSTADEAATDPSALELTAASLAPIVAQAAADALRALYPESSPTALADHAWLRESAQPATQASR